MDWAKRIVKHTLTFPHGYLFQKYFQIRKLKKQLTVTTKFDSHTPCFTVGNNFQNSSINFGEVLDCYIIAVDVSFRNLNQDIYKHNKES